jgi:hypothetical protein
MDTPQNKRLYFEVHSSSPLACCIGERRPTFAKAYGMKVRCYWELSEEHVRTLGTLCFDPAPPTKIK